MNLKMKTKSSKRLTNKLNSNKRLKGKIDCPTYIK